MNLYVYIYIHVNIIYIYMYVCMHECIHIYIYTLYLAILYYCTIFMCLKFSHSRNKLINALLAVCLQACIVLNIQVLSSLV